MGCAMAVSRWSAGREPAFAARVRAASGGGGGMSAVMEPTNTSSSSIRNALLNRLSKPIVEVGLPLSERPQTEPE